MSLLLGVGERRIGAAEFIEGSGICWDTSLEGTGRSQHPNCRLGLRRKVLVIGPFVKGCG